MFDIFIYGFATVFGLLMVVIGIDLTMPLWRYLGGLLRARERALEPQPVRLQVTMPIREGTVAAQQPLEPFRFFERKQPSQETLTPHERAAAAGHEPCGALWGCCQHKRRWHHGSC